MTIPTLFQELDLEWYRDGVVRHIHFLRDGGFREGHCVILSGGGADDFSTMSILERLQVAQAVMGRPHAQIPVTVGTQSASTRELHRLAERRRDFEILTLRHYTGRLQSGHNKAKLWWCGP